MRDSVEARSDIPFENPLRPVLLTESNEAGFNRICCRAATPKSVRIRIGCRFRDGIKASKYKACIALSRMVGIERGRRPPLLLGMYTLRNGRGWYPRRVSDWMASAFCCGVFQIAPSTPGVRLPVFSVTRLTARALPLNERVSKRCKAFTLPHLPA